MQDLHPSLRRSLAEWRVAGRIVEKACIFRSQFSSACWPKWNRQDDIAAECCRPRATRRRGRVDCWSPCHAGRIDSRTAAPARCWLCLPGSGPVAAHDSRAESHVRVAVRRASDKPDRTSKNDRRDVTARAHRRPRRSLTSPVARGLAAARGFRSGVGTSATSAVTRRTLSSLDIELRQDMRATLRELRAKLGFATVFVTHDRQEANAVAVRRVALTPGGGLDESMADSEK
jgi:hypothetical protein